MQSLMGDRLLQWFLKGKRSRFLHALGATAKSQRESEASMSDTADAMGKEAADVNDAGQDLLEAVDGLMQNHEKDSLPGSSISDQPLDRLEVRD